MFSNLLVIIFVDSLKLDFPISCKKRKVVLSHDGRTDLLSYNYFVLLLLGFFKHLYLWNPNLNNSQW